MQLYVDLTENSIVGIITILKEVSDVSDYAKMYAVLCGAASDAVDCLRAGKTEQAEQLLLSALQRAEEIYLAEGEETTG